MTRHRARYHFGAIVLISHFAGIGIYLYFAFTLIPPQLDDFWPTVLGVSSLLPLTSVYAMTFWRYVVKNPSINDEEKKKPMDRGPYLFQLIMLLFFAFSLIGMLFFLFLRSDDLGLAFDSIPSVVSLMEMVFGGFVGLTFSTLFPLQWEDGAGAGQG